MGVLRKTRKQPLGKNVTGGLFGFSKRGKPSSDLSRKHGSEYARMYRGLYRKPAVKTFTAYDDEVPEDTNPMFSWQ